jgi:hypothetical protein
MKWAATCPTSAGAFSAASAARTALNCSGNSRGQDCRVACAAAATSSSRCTGSGLELRAQPADLAAKLFVGSLAVQRDEMGEKIVVADVGGPAIGGEHCVVEIVMQAAQQSDEATVVNVALGLG